MYTPVFNCDVFANEIINQTKDFQLALVNPKMIKQDLVGI